MHRNWILNKLQVYKPYSNAERESLSRMTKLITSQPRCFERDCMPGHVTGSAWILNADETEVLLTHHKKLNKWLPLGGHSDGESNTREVARREAFEESGIEGLQILSEDIFDVDVHTIPANSRDPEHEHHDVTFLFRAPMGAAFQVSDESHDLAWVKVSRIGDYTSEPSILRLAEKTRLRAKA